jgi:ribosomal protein L32
MLRAYLNTRSLLNRTKIGFSNNIQSVVKAIGNHFLFLDYLQPQIAGFPADAETKTPNIPSLEDILKGVWNMGVPKSRVSHSRKRMRHGQHIPKKVHWYTCERCGESRKPHRVCVKNSDICALREDEWQLRKKDATADTASKVGN